MTIKVIQINIWMGKFLHELVDFLCREDPDIIMMQEVTGGSKNLCEDKNTDLFSYLREALRLEGVVAPRFRIRGEAGAYMGNAVFTKGKILSSKTVWLKDYAEISREDDNEKNWPNFPLNALDATIDLRGVAIHALSVHGAWTRDPIDTPEKLRQAHILAEYLKKLGGEPFLLGGDTNMQRGSETINIIESVSYNTAADPASRMTRSTHPTIHKTASFKPQGLLVDFIFTSKHFKVISVDAPVVDISDHLPIRATFEIK